MRHIRLFGHGLSQLLREGETESLELVIGLLAFILGIQLALNLYLGALVSILNVLPYWLVVIMSLLLIVGGIAKVYGAIMGHVPTRLIASLSLSGVWLSIALANYNRAGIFTLSLFSLLALQSAWVYIRLSILRKRGQA